LASQPYREPHLEVERFGLVREAKEAASLAQMFVACWLDFMLAAALLRNPLATIVQLLTEALLTKVVLAQPGTCHHMGSGCASSIVHEAERHPGWNPQLELGDIEWLSHAPI
jgi:hypothetical protein